MTSAIATSVRLHVAATIGLAIAAMVPVAAIVRLSVVSMSTIRLITIAVVAIGSGRTTFCAIVVANVWTNVSAAR